MKYIPNRHKLCTVCGSLILYNERYIGEERLLGNGEVVGSYYHKACEWAGTSFTVSSANGSPANINVTGLAPTQHALPYWISQPQRAHPQYKVTPQHNVTLSDYFNPGTILPMKYIAPKHKSGSWSSRLKTWLSLLIGGNDAKKDKE
jgi:hypothetical protein